MVAANAVGFNKIAIIAFENDTILPASFPNIFCFGKDGKEYFISQCYASLLDEISLLCSDTFNAKKAPLFAITNKNGQINVRTKHTLHKFLKKNDYFLLDNRRLDETILPKSDYYVFVDWYFWNFGLDGLGKVFAKTDSIAAMHPNKVTLIFIHPKSPDCLVASEE